MKAKTSATTANKHKPTAARETEKSSCRIP
jgi:hypothetical protein